MTCGFARPRTGFRSRKNRSRSNLPVFKPLLSGGYFVSFTNLPCHKPFAAVFNAAGVARGTDASNDPDLAGGQRRAINPDCPALVLSSKLAPTGATGDRRYAAVAGLSGVYVQYPAASALAP